MKQGLTISIQYNDNCTLYCSLEEARFICESLSELFSDQKITDNEITHEEIKKAFEHLSDANPYLNGPLNDDTIKTASELRCRPGALNLDSGIKHIFAGYEVHTDSIRKRLIIDKPLGFNPVYNTAQWMCDVYDDMAAKYIKAMGKIKFLKDELDSKQEEINHLQEQLS